MRPARSTNPAYAVVWLLVMLRWLGGAVVLWLLAAPTWAVAAWLIWHVHFKVGKRR